MDHQHIAAQRLVGPGLAQCAPLRLYQWCQPGDEGESTSAAFQTKSSESRNLASKKHPSQQIPISSFFRAVVHSQSRC